MSAHDSLVVGDKFRARLAGELPNVVERYECAAAWRDFLDSFGQAERVRWKPKSAIISHVVSPGAPRSKPAFLARA